MPANVQKKRLFVSTGCSSSDILMAPLLAELTSRGGVGEVTAVGGEPLREQGAELIYDSTPLSTIGTMNGVVMFLRKGMGLLRALRKLDQRWSKEKPDLMILVDNAGINFRLLPIAHKHKIPILYYIPPELWSIFRLELKGLKRTRPRIAAIFESQAEEYRALGLDSEWIGHPMLDLVRNITRAPTEVGSTPVIGLFPGSRKQEVKQLAGPMREAAQRIYEKEPDARFILCAANPLAHGYLKRDLAKWKIPVELRYRESHRVLSQCHVALACSGTITLEATLFGVPMIAMYRLNSLFDNLLQKLVLPTDKYRFFSLPNVLLGEGAVPELINKNVNGERIAREALSLLRDHGRREAMLASLARVRPMLGQPGAVQRAADIAEEMMGCGPKAARSAA